MTGRAFRPAGAAAAPAPRAGHRPSARGVRVRAAAR